MVTYGVAKVSDMLILGLDIGTSGCKVIAFDENWSVAAHSHREYNHTRPLLLMIKYHMRYLR